MSRTRSQMGVTLLEMLGVVAVMGLLLAGMYNTFEAQYRSYVLQDQMSEMNQNARIAVEIMSKEIRNAAFDPNKVAAGTGANAGIKVATNTSLEFSQDIWDAACTTPVDDGAISCPGEWVGYRYNAAAGGIDRCSSSTTCIEADWQPFVDDIQGLQFNYVYADGGSSSDPLVGLPNDADADDTNDFEDIREVQVQVVAKRRTSYGGGFESTTLTSRVQVRNLALH